MLSALILLMDNFDEVEKAANEIAPADSGTFTIQI